MIGMGLAALAVIGLLWYVRHLQIQNTSLRLERDRAIQVARDNAAVAETVQADAARGYKALTNAHKTELARLKKAQKVLKEIADAPVTMACASSPAVSAALHSLRRGSVPKAEIGKDTASH